MYLVPLDVPNDTEEGRGARGSEKDDGRNEIDGVRKRDRKRKSGRKRRGIERERESKRRRAVSQMETLVPSTRTRVRVVRVHPVC